MSSLIAIFNILKNTMFRIGKALQNSYQVLILFRLLLVI
jgi:hypothetical protein